MKILKDANNNIFKTPVTSYVPEGYIDITDSYELDESLNVVDEQYLEVAFDQDSEKWIASKKSDADKDMRNKILEELRYNRSPLLAEADVEINKLEDASADSSAWRAYRQALRDVPAAYIKADGDPKVATDSIDLDNFSWPEKP